MIIHHLFANISVLTVTLHMGKWTVPGTKLFYTELVQVRKSCTSARYFHPASIRKKLPSPIPDPCLLADLGKIKP